MSQIEMLAVELKHIIILLKKSGNMEPVRYFETKLQEINRDAKESAHAIRELSGCRAMSQYADFSITEESQLNKVVEIALNIARDGLKLDDSI